MHWVVRQWGGAIGLDTCHTQPGKLYENDGVRQKRGWESIANAHYGAGRTPSVSTRVGKS